MKHEKVLENMKKTAFCFMGETNQMLVFLF